jgi:hypothetical protein
MTRAVCPAWYLRQDRGRWKTKCNLLEDTHEAGTCQHLSMSTTPLLSSRGEVPCMRSSLDCMEGSTCALQCTLYAEVSQHSGTTSDKHIPGEETHVREHDHHDNNIFRREPSSKRKELDLCKTLEALKPAGGQPASLYTLAIIPLPELPTPWGHAR